MPALTEDVACKLCGGSSVVRYGYARYDGQRLMCRACGRTFLDNRAPARMHFPAEAIAATLDLFYEGVPLVKVRQHLCSSYDLTPDSSTLHRWIMRYSKLAAERLRHVSIKVGPTWIAAETRLQAKEAAGPTHPRLWLIDCLDSETRFLLGSCLSTGRSAKDAGTLMKCCARLAGTVPRVVVTSTLTSYLDGIESAFGSDTRHIQAGKSAGEARLVELLHQTLRDRTAVMRSRLSEATATVVRCGSRIHYNFFRPHAALGGRTPAEIAGVRTEIRGWADVVGDRQSGTPLATGLDAAPAEAAINRS